MDLGARRSAAEAGENAGTGIPQRSLDRPRGRGSVSTGKAHQGTAARTRGTTTASTPTGPVAEDRRPDKGHHDQQASSSVAGVPAWYAADGEVSRAGGSGVVPVGPDVGGVPAQRHGGPVGLEVAEPEVVPAPHRPRGHPDLGREDPGRRVTGDVEQRAERPAHPTQGRGAHRVAAVW